jgi:hypothetical protein
MMALTLSLYLGYGIASQIGTDPVPMGNNGIELRALMGGEQGDQWSVWLGSQQLRRTKEGIAYKFIADELPGYDYVAGLRRFNKHLEHFTVFVGTGVAYRDLSTCMNGQLLSNASPPKCISGDPYVSSHWAFAQESGVRWRCVELSVAHFSTGGITAWNHGINLFRFTFLGKLPGHEP